jgi:phosphoribosyl 1,2-cyclic phosphodiesterase
MSLRVRVLASGSKGNAALYSAGSTHVLLDCGISARRIEAALRQEGLCPEDLAAVFLTHEHTDHVQGLRVFLKNRSIPLFAAPECLESPALRDLSPWHAEPLAGGVPVTLGPISLTPFALPHDAAACFGFVVESGGVRAVQATDLGTPTALVRRRLEGAHCLLLEFNHDLDRLLHGGYPLDLKMRIKGRLGHLSNEQAASLLASCLHPDLEALYLMHLSEENNLPELALLAAREALAGRKVALAVARPDGPAPPWQG